MTTRKKTPAAFSDVKQVLDLALKRPGLRYECKSYSDAVSFRHRCNAYRKLLREISAEQMSGIPGFRPETIYDTIVISLTNTQGQTDSKAGTVLVFQSAKLTGRLIDPETGKELQLEDEETAEVLPELNFIKDWRPDDE